VFSNIAHIASTDDLTVILTLKNPNPDFLFQLGQTFVLVGSVLTGLITLWLFAWTFARSTHVERRLAAGLEIDEPKLSILANFRDSGPVPSRS